MEQITVRQLPRQVANMIKILVEYGGYTKAQIVILAITQFYWHCLGETVGRELMDKAMLAPKEDRNDGANN